MPQQLELAQQDLFNQLIFSDYLFAKDRLFAHLNLSGNELSMYERLYEIMVKDIPRYLSAGEYRNANEEDSAKRSAL